LSKLARAGAGIGAKAGARVSARAGARVRVYIYQTM
jgi:hypothetical protein